MMVNKQKSELVLLKPTEGIFILLLVLAPFLLSGQPCLEEVTKVFDLMAVNNETGKVNYMNYTVTSTLDRKASSGTNIVSTSAFKVYSQGQKVRLYSNEIIVLRDEKKTYTILPHKKLIYLTKTYEKENASGSYNGIRQMQDSLFKHHENLACKPIEGQRYNMEVSFDLDERMSNYLQMKKVEYSINTTTSTLHKVLINYRAGMQYKQLVYEFKEQVPDYKKVNMQTPLYNLIFERNGALKAKYAGYKYIDNINK